MGWESHRIVLQVSITTTPMVILPYFSINMESPIQTLASQFLYFLLQCLVTWSTVSCIPNQTSVLTLAAFPDHPMQGSASLITIIQLSSQLPLTLWLCPIPLPCSFFTVHFPTHLLISTPPSPAYLVRLHDHFNPSLAFSLNFFDFIICVGKI